MKRLILFIMLTAFVFTSAQAQDKKATPDDAKTWVKKAIALYKEVGPEKAFAEFNNPNGKFNKGELYILVYDLEGKCFAQGSDSTAVGKVRLDIKDVDGKFIVKDRIEIAKDKGEGWQNYKWANPVSKKTEDKTVFIEKVDGFVFACGAYGKN